jgi:hypothetical protein
MLTLQRWALVALMSMLATLPALAQVDAASAERLLRRSGLWAQLDAVAPQVLQGLAEAAAQGGRPPPPAEAERLAAAARAAYAGERLRSIALRQVAQELAPQHLAALMAWYASPTGVLMTRLEERSAADPRSSDVVQAEGQARWQALPPERQGQIDALLQAGGSIDSALSITLNTIAGVRQGLASVMPPGEGPTPEATRALLAEQLPRLRPAFEQLLRAASALAYTDASDAQLAEYLGFLRSPAGQHLSDLVLRVLDAAFLDGATELGRRLAPPAGTPA